MDAGYKNVMVVKQSFEEWKKLHLPIAENNDGRVYNQE
jgi:hypothetical protein